MSGFSQVKMSAFRKKGQINEGEDAEVTMSIKKKIFRMIERKTKKIPRTEPRYYQSEGFN